MGGVFSRLWPLLVGRVVRRSSSSRGSGPGSSTRSGRSFSGAPQRGSCCWVDCCLACPRAGVLAVFRAVAGCHAGIDGCRFSSPSGVEVGSFSYTLAFSRQTSVLSRCRILAWLVSWGRWLVLGWCLCLAWTLSSWSCLFLPGPSLRSAGGVGLHS